MHFCCLAACAAAPYTHNMHNHLCLPLRHARGVPRPCRPRCGLPGQMPCCLVVMNDEEGAAGSWACCGASVSAPALSSRLGKRPARMDLGARMYLTHPSDTVMGTICTRSRVHITRPCACLLHIFISTHTPDSHHGLCSGIQGFHPRLRGCTPHPGRQLGQRAATYSCA